MLIERYYHYYRLALQNYEAFDSINEVLFITKVEVTLSNLGLQATRENLLQTAIRIEKEGIDSVCNITTILWPLRPQTSYHHQRY